jgi:replicative DNA helicase
MSQLHVFDKVFDSIVKRKEIKDAGGYIGIPYAFPSLNKILGAIEKSTVIGITANSGVSKSKFTRFVYIYSVYKFHKKTNYPVKIIYFPLEDSHEEIIHNMICFYLKETYNMNISVQHLNQLGEYDLSMATIKRIAEARSYFADLYNILTIVDYASTPSEIYSIGKSWALENGEIKEKVVDGLTEVTHYKPKTDVHTIFIIDNLSNILAERRHADERDAIGELVRIWCRKVMAQKFGFTVVVVQQQSQSKEKVQFSSNGRQMYEKYEPSLGDLADNLTTQRAFHLAFGIFSPERYPDLHSYWGYDIDVLGGFFRSVKILKSNKSGSTGKIIPLWFDGASEHYEQMPPAPLRDEEMVSAELDHYYQRAAMIRNRKTSFQLEL